MTTETTTPGDGGPPSVTITCNGSPKSGKAHLVAKFPDGTAFTNTIKIGSVEERTAYRDAVLQRCEGLKAEDIDAQLETLAAGLLGADDDDADGAAGGGGGGSVATQIVDLIENDAGVELFHTPGGMDSEGYATITIGGHRETWAIASKAFKRWVSRRFFVEAGSAPKAQSLIDAIGVLAGKALFEGKEREVHVRVAAHDGAIWIDLGDEGWRAIKVTGSGWEVVDRDIPVRFVRKRGMKPLPAPVRGGRIQDLRSLVNLRRDEDWVLAVSWLIAAFRPNFPFPVLNTTGEQGSAKSTLCKMLRALIDPAKPALRRPPKDERDLAIAASNSHVVAYDNISNISATLSDAMCCLATGGGFGTRELYTDDDEKLFDYVRPVMLNGIDDSVSRSDLLDRTLSLNLSTIPEAERRDENELWAEFERKRAGILGALLDAVSLAMARLPSTRLGCKPRMADFALWIVAAEPALPWKPGDFLRVYSGNRAESDVAAVEASIVGPSMLRMIEELLVWAGTATDLLALLNEKYATEATKKERDWPKNSKAMGSAVRRIAPNLRRMGMIVELPNKGVGHDKARHFRFERSSEEWSARSASSANPPGGPGKGDPTPPAADHAPAVADDEEDERSALDDAEPLIPGMETPPADRADHADRSPRDYSQGSGEWWKL